MSFDYGRTSVCRLGFVAVDFAVVFRIERTVLCVEILRGHRKDVAVLFALEARCVVASIGVNHALGEGAGMHELGERGSEVVVSSFELALSANHDVQVSERGEFGVGTGRIAAEFGLVRRRPILLGVRRTGLALLSGRWWGEQPAGDKYECSEGSPRLRRTVHANGFSV